MTVKELKEALSNISDDSKAVITMTCDNNFREIGEVRTCISGLTIIESHDIPDFADLEEIAKEVYQEHLDDLAPKERRLLEIFLRLITY